MANRLFGQQGYDFRPAYLTLLRETFGAPLEILDFVKNPAAASKDINAWVKKQTRERIRNLIPADALNKETRLVLCQRDLSEGPLGEGIQ